MKKKVLLFAVIATLLLVTAWMGGILPRQIAKYCGTGIVQSRFPEMGLEYETIEWNKYYGDYIITFRDKEEITYGCVISPKWFPVCLGQGTQAIEDAYRDIYERQTADQ